jgi:hypothetical protein
MVYKINGLEVSKEVTIITYSRKPTATEIKLGYGAIHYRDFKIAECFDENGNFKRQIVSSNDNLKYSYQ